MPSAVMMAVGVGDTTGVGTVGVMVGAGITVITATDACGFAGGGSRLTNTKMRAIKPPATAKEAKTTHKFNRDISQRVICTNYI